jgi:hypothetical protein
LNLTSSGTTAASKMPMTTQAVAGIAIAFRTFRQRKVLTEKDTVVLADS